HPHAPIRPGRSLPIPIDMDEIVLEEVAGRLERLLALEQPRAAYWKDRLVEQPVDLEPGIIAIAEPDRDINLIAGEVERQLRYFHAHIGVRHDLKEAVEPRHQPFGG